MTSAACAMENGDGCVYCMLDVHAGAKRDAFPAGVNVWRSAVGCSIRAPPVEGKANKAIVKLVSSVLGIPKSSVTIVSGQTSSVKRVCITGMDKAALVKTLDNRL
ncbi:DUF167 domain-containing protein [Methanogenium sp. MK-MG]|uniref:DUF167 domain-containing protein n=1 Tax=Methanogenium sp. MK-MG TaxID=2599926 RepID=UPI0013EC10E8|nr:DUF167 domain-containing protein [Methanogenium sp. MK-MG]KAF1079050.1 hypothetical protein MKMG_00060 [Methanogenium sp. MK-MG]